ncbi:MAG: DUF4159 domain-containing protein [Phycisphaerales bacterium]|nr:DUF4159 domain-containing protein [Phycisphaerales bacterium]
MNRPRSTCLAVALVATILFQPGARAQVTGAQVRDAIADAVRHLKARQQPDGSWRSRDRYEHGYTCLATLALLLAGEAPTSPPMARALNVIAHAPDEYTYVVSLKIMALAQADPEKYKEDIERSARWLMRAQDESGLWSYQLNPVNYDHSNSQFALLGLNAAAQAGVKVPAGVWQAARRRVLTTQNSDGGWSYTFRGSSYGSMTAAGVSDLLILGGAVVSPVERGVRNGVAPGCGRYREDKPLLNGLRWLGREFSAIQNPGHGRSNLHYWLYAVERCGILSGLQMLGRHDWYREGAAKLVSDQRADGGWGTIENTCFSIMFLAKGRKPLLVQKLQWSADDDWNPDRNDLEHLLDRIGDKLGEPMSWQSVPFDAPLERWLAAPLLYMQGHKFPEWTPNQREKVRQYVEQGGTLFLEACCGREDFRNGAEAFLAETFPLTPLHELDSGHPVYHAYQDVAPAGLMGVDVGCRTSIIYSPFDLSCHWEQANIPLLGERAFDLGLNIAAFATGRRPLRDRLDLVKVAEREDINEPPPPGDPLVLAQVEYHGDWQPDPHALAHFAEYLNEQAGLRVAASARATRLTPEELPRAPFLYMTGHYAFELSGKERAALAAHLRRGGFLFADACCGRREFDASFRAMLRQVAPQGELRRLEPTHPIFSGSPGFRIESVGYRAAALAENPNLSRPELWGLETDGRLAVVYSPYGLGCGLDGHACYNCRGILEADARRMATNVVLYALTR